jgi:putative ABC transport system ATP-binding protein
MSEAAPAPSDVVVLDKVSRVYPARGEAEEVRAVRNVSLRIRRGSRVAIRGDSGSGKSTLLNLLGGLDVASSGSVQVNGRELSRLSERQLTRYRAETVGFVFQTFNLLPTLNARENVELPMEARGVGPTERRERAVQLLQAVGMEERALHRPTRMSGGEQQRVAIARALANRPAIILADEPTGNLDRKSRRAVIRLLETVNREFGTTLIIVTHDPNTAASCEVVFRIRRGRLVGPPSAPGRALTPAEEGEPVSEAVRQEEEDAGDDDDPEDDLDDNDPGDVPGKH